MTEKKPVKQEPTEYVVLERLVIEPIGPDATKALGKHAATLKKGVWVYLGQTKGTGSERKIIDAVVGNRPGTFKAVAARSWAGGETKAQETIMASKPFEEA